MADELGYDDAKRLLNETLNEESAADELLTKIATGGLLGQGLVKIGQGACPGRR